MNADQRFAVANALSAQPSNAGDPQSAVAEDVAESTLANLVDEITQRLNTGEIFDIDQYAARYPEIADTLNCVLETLLLVRQSPTAGDTSVVCGSPDPAHVGLLGDFRIVRELGRGGMGVVYEAEQISLGRRVALKVLPFAAMLDRQQLARFKNEARAAATLDHPNIVAIYSVGVERSVHFYAMQLIEGQSLAQVVDQLRQSHLPLPLGEGRGEGSRGEGQVGAASRAALPDNSGLSDSSPARLAGPTADTAPIAHLTTLPDFDSHEYYRSVALLGIQAAEALDHAHQNGILHRDIKPANLLVECSHHQCSHHAPRDEKCSNLAPRDGANPRQGRGSHHAERDAYTLKLWITDFGLARMEADAGMTMTGDILGTLRYMSPEQALAKHVVVDHRSDIYSLGVTLYELLTLRPAFTGDDRQEILRQIAFDDPRPLRQINSHIPEDLQKIVLKAIEKNPADRYITAQALRNDLLAFLEHRPITARSASLANRARKWFRRHRQVAIAFSLVLLTMALMMAAGIGWSMRGSAARQAAAEATAKLSLENAVHFAKDAQWQEAILAIKQGREQIAETSGREKLKDQLARLQYDLEMALKLEEIYFDLPIINDVSRTRVARSNSDIANAFLKYGIDVNTLTSNQVEDAIGKTSIPIELAAALDFWAIRERMQGTKNLVWKRLLSIARAVDPDPWRNRLRLAIEQNGDDQRASLLGLAASAQIDNLTSTSIVGLATALHRCGEPGQALSLLHSRQQKYPDDFLINCNLAHLYFAQSREKAVDQCIRFGTAAVSIRPRNSAALNILVLGLFEKGAFDKSVLDEAIVFAKEVVRLAPGEWWAHHNLAANYHRKGEIDESIACYKEALRLGSTFSMTHQELGSLYEDKRHIDDAIASYSEALRIEPRQHAINRLGELLRQKHGAEKMIDYYRRLLRDEPDLAYAHFGLAREQFDKGLFEDSIRSYQSALKLTSAAHPQHIAQLRYELGNALRQNGLLEEAIACNKQAVDLCDLDYIREMLGDLYVERRQWQKAIESYQQTIRLSPDRPGIHFRLSWLLATCPKVRYQNADRAVELAKKEVELQPDHARGWTTLGVAYYRAGALNDAIISMNKARRLLPKLDQYGGFFLAMAYRGLGDNDEARKSYDITSDWVDKNAAEDEELLRFRAEAARVLGVNDELPSKHHNEPSEDEL